MSRRPPSRSWVALFVVLLLGACAGPEPSAVVKGPVDGRSPTDEPGGAGDSSPAPDDDRPGDHASLSAWSDCGDGLECATATVPRDWADPDGDTLDLSVIRRPANGEPTGSLLVNPGGPGVSGVEFLRSFVVGGIPDGLTDAFDVVSWDPRGTGGSSAIECTTEEQWLEPDLDPTPDSQSDIDDIREQAETSLDRCEEAAGPLLDLVGTRATVRDLEALRQLLGDDGLTYLGYSYGTTIGLEYLRTFPTRVRAMVLDAVTIPGVEPVADTLTQARGFERTLDSYLADCPARPSCPLGDDPKAALLDLVDEVEHIRVPASYVIGDDPTVREGTLGVGELYVAIVASLYSEAAWPTLDRGLAELMDDPASGVTLLSLRDSYLGRAPDGTWDDSVDARVAIRCADQVERAEQPEGDTDLIDDWSEELPFWGAWFAVGTPGCWGFDPAIEPLEPMPAGSVTEAPPVVLIGTTNDPATPYEQAVEAQRVVVDSRLITYEGDEHTIYRGTSACVDGAATPYLVDLVVPDDVRCTD
ncbi:MAG: alpha/beta hydrolase [Acidimicrobiales bacterium]|nr:alpha/beta hydrolase [Acidimicrobiales bacterium]